MPSLNPARALGPSFVLNRWDHQWVVWAGPILGGCVGALMHTLILGGKRNGSSGTPDSPDPDSSSVQSDEDAYDRLDKPHSGKIHGHSHPHHSHSAAYSTYRPSANHHNPGLGGYCPTLTATSLYPGGGNPNKLERVESLYGGTRSLYCRSPPLTRANLHRSQSVYSKPPRAATTPQASVIPPPGPLLPARSLYQPRMDHQIMAHNQNAQNQLQAREATYVSRQTALPTSRDVASGTYGTRQNPTGAPGVTTVTVGETRDDQAKMTRRPESMYGMVVAQPRRNQSAQSDDSSYGSYRAGPGAATVQNGGVPGGTVGAYHHHIPPPVSHQY